MVKKTRSAHAVGALLCVALAVGGIAPAAAVEIVDPDSMIVLDMDAFTKTQPTTKLGYDYLKLGTALQGIVNRDEPRLFLLGDASSIAKQYGFHPDDFWLDELTQPGGVSLRY